MAQPFLTVYFKDIIKGVFKVKKKDACSGTYFMVLRIGDNGK